MEKMIREVKSKYRKRFIFVVALIALIVIAFIIYAIVSKVTAKNVCYDDSCYEIAEKLYSNLNVDVDPCENFYEFSCGGWINKNPRPEKEQYWSILSPLRTGVMERLRVILEGNENNDNLTLPMIKAQNFYKSCIDTENRDKTAKEGIILLLRQVFGCPLLDNDWNERNYDWQNALTILLGEQNEVTPFLELTSRRDRVTNYTSRILFVKVPQFLIGSSLDDKYRPRNEKNELEMKFRYKLKKILKYFGVTDSREVDKQIDDVIEFEIGLVAASKSYDYANQHVRVSASNMTQYINFNLARIIQTVYSRLNYPFTFDVDDSIVIQDLTYLKKMSEILKNTKKRTIANYVGLMIMKLLGEKTIMEIENIDQESPTDFKGLLSGCYWKTEKYFQLPIHELYINTYFKKGELEKLKDFVKHLKASLTLTLQMNDWMDDETKLKAQLKLNKMLDIMATPESRKKISNFYSELGYMESNNFYKNFMKLSRFMAKKALSLDPKSSAFSVATINAFYSPYDNQIEVTPGILQPPVYYTNAPIAMNFAAIGTIIGHEITHGFDDSGSKYDESGRYRDWWANATREKYEEKVKCFINQYSSYTEPKSGLKVNGTFTIGDNIADNGGLHQSYTAYKMYTSENTETNERLPGDMKQYTPEQLFFISYGSLWCENNSKEFAKTAIKRDPHAPNRFRNIVPLSNSEQFAEAFKCASDSPMNPKEKCVLW